MKKKTEISGVILFVAAVIFLFYRFAPFAPTPQPLDPRDSNSITCSGAADLFLYNLKTGWSNDAKEYWKTGVDPKLLFSVSDYRHLSDGYFKTGTLLFYDYEVNSSTEGGIPIRKHWSIIVDPDADSAKGKKCAIVDLREAE